MKEERWGGVIAKVKEMLGCPKADRGKVGVETAPIGGQYRNSRAEF